MKKMIILPGNAAKEGKYVAEDGKTYPEWKDGALHEGAAKDYASRLCYDPVVIHKGGLAAGRRQSAGQGGHTDVPEGPGGQGLLRILGRRLQRTAHSRIPAGPQSSNPLSH